MVDVEDMYRILDFYLFNGHCEDEWLNEIGVAVAITPTSLKRRAA